jgi:phosphatidylserine/phosphatidylglycerophosphate/cardiolipin synthase-like enzyme
LRKLANDFPNQLKVAEYATHEKMLVIDGKTVVFGSANWLSNRQYKNSERSIVVIDVAIAESEEHRISELVRENRVI